MPFNPYHQWLGLNPDLYHPNYFQLLGISSKVEDPQGYQAMVEEAVRKQTAMLAQVEAGTRQPMLDQLTQRVRRAGTVLSNPESRDNYLRKLKTETPGTLPPASEASADPKNNPRVTANRSAELGKSLPASLPLAQTTNEFSNVQAEPRISAGLGSTRSKPKKKKMSGLILICTGLICVASIVGPLLVVNRLLNKDSNPISQSDPTPSPVADLERLQPRMRAPQNPPSETPANRKPEGNLPTSVSETKRPDSGDATSNRPGDRQRISADNQAPDKSPTDSNMSPKDQFEDARSNSNSGSTLLIPAAPPKELAALDLYSIQSLSRRIPAAFRRRDSEVIVLINELKQKLAPFRSQSDPNGVIRAGLNLADSFEFVQAQLTAFWNVVRQGFGQTLPGDFAVEGIPHQVRTRSNDYIEFQLPGGTIKHYYQFMPPSVAIAGARNHASVDTNAHRLHLAAFIVTQAGQVRERNEDDLQKLLLLLPTESAQLKTYLEETSSAMKAPCLLATMPEGKALDQALKDLLARHSVADMKKLTPEEGLRTGRKLLNLSFTDPQEAVVAVECARRLAIAGGDAYLLADAVLELSYLTELNLYESYCDSFNDLTAEQLNIDQIQRSMEVVYPLTETADKDMVSRFKRLKTKLKKQGAVFGLMGFAQLSELR